MVDQPSAGTGPAAVSTDYYVAGGVNWPGYTLLQLVTMVAEQASVPQLERLALDWREAGDGIVETSDFLADALDDLMNYWTGSSAEKARHTVALNAQWVSDLGATARDMGGPIQESAGALKAAQEAMPKIAATLPADAGAMPVQADGTTQSAAAAFQQQPASAPLNAQRVSALTGTPTGAAVGATAAGARSAFAAQAEQADAKRVAVETMQRFETAAVGIDRATPRFLGQNDTLMPRNDGLAVDPDADKWARKVTTTTGIDARWRLLTNLPLDATTAQRLAGLGVGGSNFGLINGNFTGVGGIGGINGLSGFGDVNGGMSPVTGGPSAIGGLSGGEGAERLGGGAVARAGGLGTGAAGTAFGGANSGAGVGGPVGATPMGAGALGAAAASAHRRRVPYDADDPFDTGQKASPPVIGL